MKFISLLIAPCICVGFAPSPLLLQPSPLLSSSTSPLFLSSSEDSSSSGGRRQSRFEGMQREPTTADMAIIDDMITKLSNAKAYELPNAVSRSIRVVSSPQFFLRIAERADKATDEMEKEKLSALADNLVNTIQAVVSMTEDNLDDRAKDVERVVKAASEPDSGEFLVPLSTERVEAMRSVMQELEREDLNEGFLTTIDAWMNKAQQDGMDGMVTIMQKALQIYAGTQISRARIQLQANVGAALAGEDQSAADAAAVDHNESVASALLEKLLHVDTDNWDVAIQNGIEGGDVSKEALVSEVQKTMEAVVLGLENGSMVQRVQAEFLRELVTRIEAV